MKKRIWFLALLMTAFLCLFTACGASAPEEPGDAAMTGENGAPETAAETGAAPAITAETGSSIAAYSFDVETGAREESDSVSFFSFHKSGKTYTENGTELLVQSLTSPRFYSSDRGVRVWVDELIDEIRAADIHFGQELLENARQASAELGEDFYSYSHHVSMELGRHDSDVASLLALSSAFSGGDHPSSLQTAWNLDLRELRVLTLEDVIREGSAPALEKLVIAGVEEKFADLGQELLFEDYVRIISGGMEPGSMTSCWFFSDRGLTVFYNQYELAPYAAGIISVELSYEALEDILRPEYIREQCSDTVTGIRSAETAEDGMWVYHVDFGGEDTLYFSLEGEACSVRLSEVLYLQQTTVKETMMFSASYLDSQTAIAITGQPREDAVYRVEYCSGGENNTLYIRGDEILSDLPMDETREP